MAVAVLSSSISCSTTSIISLNHKHNRSKFSAFTLSLRFPLRPINLLHVCTPPHQEDSLSIDKSSLVVDETTAEDQLWAAAVLRVRSFHQFDPDSFGVPDHKKHLAEREFEAMKERIAGKRKEFRTVACINATLPLSQISSVSEELCAECKGIGGDFARAYLSNVCVAKELHRNGLGYEIVAKSKLVAQGWGISDLYVHVAFDNEPAKKLYMKNGFIFENDEPAWHARFLDRPRRILLWIGLPGTKDL
ncbi:N-acetyltransferase domain-containing protein [Citrus sinensis]|uniref:uncharacterized protein LOC102612453 isoform X2 n=1 Tax=Citrus sinensis TaxID=2711 RepID=UPI0003D760DA|nr:uncharacterized protein LOC102612453 isoform X2 [Citrus sinensis]XP_024048075.1 uncharacterized protein LOC18055354 isoform X2 [Citrus x clementina]KAH9654128.1 N-acetyltransferase domain-containing protein [Citrus sinensis]